MANFFKDYQKQVNARRQERQRTKERQKTRCEYLQNLEQGAKVKVNKAYAESGFLYFVSYIDKSTVLLNDNKTKAKQE